MSTGPAICPEATTRDVFEPIAIQDEQLFCYTVFKFIHIKLNEAPLLGDVDLLAARELEPGPAEFNHMLLVLQVGVDGHYDLANVDPGHCALGLSKATAHTCLEPVSSNTGQHLVDAGDREGLEPHSDVEATFAITFHHVLVGTNAGSLQGFGGELLMLIWHHVATEWELIHFCLLPLWLVRTMSVTPGGGGGGGAAAHGDTRICSGEPKGKGWDLL